MGNEVTNQTTEQKYKEFVETSICNFDILQRAAEAEIEESRFERLGRLSKIGNRLLVRNIDAFRTFTRNYIVRHVGNVTSELLGYLKCAEMAHTDFNSLHGKNDLLGLWFDPLMIAHQELKRYEELREGTLGLSGEVRQDDR